MSPTGWIHLQMFAQLIRQQVQAILARLARRAALVKVDVGEPLLVFRVEHDFDLRTSTNTLSFLNLEVSESVELVHERVANLVVAERLAEVRHAQVLILLRRLAAKPFTIIGRQAVAA